MKILIEPDKGWRPRDNRSERTSCGVCRVVSSSILSFDIRIQHSVCLPHSDWVFRRGFLLCPICIPVDKEAQNWRLWFWGEVFLFEILLEASVQNLAAVHDYNLNSSNVRTNEILHFWLRFHDGLFSKYICEHRTFLDPLHWGVVLLDSTFKL